MPESTETPSGPLPHLLILGATSDIAQSLAVAYARLGHEQTLASRDCQRLQPLADRLVREFGHAVNLVEFDALQFDSHGDFYRGLPSVPDIVICVFGYLGDHDRALADFDECRRIIESNYVGVVSILNVVAEDMRRRQRGTIIGVGSVAGDRGRRANYLYGSAKAGMAAYLSGLRQRLLRDGVHVMTVKPGFVRTRMTAGRDLPARLTAEPDQVAADIVRAQRKGRDVVYTLWMWRYVMLIIRSLPETLFKRTNL